VELPGEEFRAEAAPLEGDDYERSWAEIKNRYPFFTEHEQRAGRKIPVVALLRSRA
jgi:hypothetical protein